MNVAAIVPAAGASVRMGRPKLLIEFDGRPLIAKVVAALVDAGVDPVIVVVPPTDAPEGPDVADVARAAGALIFVPKRRPADMRDSVACGLRKLDRLGPAPDGVLIVPADSVKIETSVVARLIAGWRRRPDRIAIPIFDTSRGHPLLVPWPLARAILDLPANVGVNRLLDDHADRIEAIPVDSDSILFDLDTPEDLRALGVRTVRLFAVARERAGRAEVHVSLPSPATVGDLRRALAAQYPALATLAASVRVAVDDEYADDAAPLSPDARLALIPPVSGGGS